MNNDMTLHDLVECIQKADKVILFNVPTMDGIGDPDPTSDMAGSYDSRTNIVQLMGTGNFIEKTVPLLRTIFPDKKMYDGVSREGL